MTCNRMTREEKNRPKAVLRGFIFVLKSSLNKRSFQLLPPASFHMDLRGVENGAFSSV